VEVHSKFYVHRFRTTPYLLEQLNSKCQIQPIWFDPKMLELQLDSKQIEISEHRVACLTDVL